MKHINKIKELEQQLVKTKQQLEFRNYANQLIGQVVISNINNIPVIAFEFDKQFEVSTKQISLKTLKEMVVFLDQFNK